MVLLTLHHPNSQVCFETSGGLVDTNFIKILNKFYSSSEYGIANVVLKERRGHSKHWGSEKEDWTWKHTQDQNQFKPRKAWNSIWVFSLQNIYIFSPSSISFVACNFSHQVSRISDISTTWGSHCSLGVHFYFTFSSQGLPTQMLTLAYIPPRSSSEILAEISMAL